jgi:cytochrome P450
MLLTERTSTDALAAWDGWFLAARQAGWHGPMPALPGAEAIVRHRAARELLMDDDRFPQHFTGAFRALAVLNPNLGDDFHALLDEMESTSLINLSAERHSALRALLGPAFGPRNVNRFRPFVTDLAGRLIAALEPGDDFMAGFALHVPTTTLCELLGVPEDDRASCLGWAAALAPLVRPLSLLTMDAEQAGAVVAAREALIEYGMDLLARRRAEPRDDLISRLAADESGAFDDRALALNIGDLLFGGNDNTQRSLGQMLLILTEHPDVWEAVAADDGRFADAVVEECIRYRPGSGGAFRRTSRATQHDDADWAADQVLWISSYSANRDEDHFDDSSTFDPRRPNARDHISFGHGIHHCIGATLARAEMQECLRVLTSAITCPQVSGEIVIANEGAAGPVELPLTFERRAG